MRPPPISILVLPNPVLLLLLLYEIELFLCMFLVQSVVRQAVVLQEY